MGFLIFLKTNYNTNYAFCNNANFVALNSVLPYPFPSSAISHTMLIQHANGVAGCWSSGLAKIPAAAEKMSPKCHASAEGRGVLIRPWERVMKGEEVKFMTF